MGNYFVYNGISSRDFGVGISGSGTFNKPQRRVEKYTVPGRSGDLTIDEGAFDNVTITYPAFIARGFEHKFNDFMAAMYSATGYAKLQDTYDTDHYRKAIFCGATEPTTGTLNRSGIFDITFDCMPQRWIDSDYIGDSWRLVSGNGVLEVLNPTRYIALPLIKANAGLSSNDRHFRINSGIDDPTDISSNHAKWCMDFYIDKDIPFIDFTIDCETEEYYHEDASGITYVGEYIKYNEGTDPYLTAPKLYPGRNVIISYGNIAHMEILPRWWTI